jgi:putative ABC transport system permease protein
MNGLLQDVRYVLRQLCKSPGFTAVAVITLALGIGANTAVFSLADLIIRKPVALPGMDRLAAMDEQLPGSGDSGISPANYLDLQSESKSFEQLAAYADWSASESSQGQPQELQGVKVTRNFFSVVGVKPKLGRDFAIEEESSGTDDKVIVSNGWWKQRFGSDLTVVGKSIKLDGKPYTVIGVLPARATFPLGAPSFWMPLTMDARMRSERSALALHTLGRLRPGVTLAQARAEVETLWKHLSSLYPSANRGRTVQVVSLHDHIVLDYNRQFALLLMGVVGLVLLIACTNISAIQFARAAKRRTEIAVRAALGASRRLLFRQLLVESILLALVGGAAGALLAVYGVAVLRRTLPTDVRWFCDIDSLRVSVTSLLFTTTVTIAVGLLSGLAPAWQNSNVEINGVLAEGAVRIAGRRSHFWRAFLVVTETAMATVLLIGAALMEKGFALLASGQAGLAPTSLLTLHLTLPQGHYPQSQQIRAFEDQLLAQMQALPNARSAALASGIPYSSYENSSDLIVQDWPVAGPGETPVAMVDSVSDQYFQSVRIPLRAGREFNSSDTSVSLPVCIVSQSMAQRLWPGQTAIGKQIKLYADAAGGWLTVVGIAADIQHEIYDRSFRSVLYLPYEQAPPRSADFVIRSEGDPLQFAETVRSQIRKLDADLPVERLESLRELIHSQASALQYVAGLMTGFALLGLILACVGVYGVIANSVTERWREFAIRMALGAHSSKLLFAIIGRALLYSAMGVTAGVALSLGLAKLLSSLIYGVSAWDTSTFLAVPILLAMVALFACYAPARRAVRMNPVVALRYE